MVQITLLLDPTLVRFYANIARITGKPVEQVLCDALFRLAGELSLEALSAAREDCVPPS